MRIEVLCSGTELLRDKLNSNSVLIAEMLSHLGLSVAQVTTVGDVAADVERALRDSLKRSTIVLCSGGLGPTFDDLTRECVARVTKRPLLFSQKILKQIESRFAAIQRPMAEENKRQAYVLRGAIPIINKRGTAPGQIIPLREKILILLPGPPRELRPMMDSTVIPYLKRKYSSQFSETLILHVFGHPESEIDELIHPVVIKNWDANGVKVTFGILAHQSRIDVKATVQGHNPRSCNEILKSIRKGFHVILGDKIYGENEDTLESVVGHALKKRNLTLSLAESCTGGLIAAKATNLPGSSEYFEECVVTYSNEAKRRLLGVKEETLKRFGAVSEETAIAMALGCQKRSGSDWALSVTGIAGPAGGTKEKPVGTVCFGIASKNNVKSFTCLFHGDRSQIRERAALTALDELRKEIKL